MPIFEKPGHRLSDRPTHRKFLDRIVMECRNARRKSPKCPPFSRLHIFLNPLWCKSSDSNEAEARNVIIGNQKVSLATKIPLFPPKSHFILLWLTQPLKVFRLYCVKSYGVFAIFIQCYSILIGREETTQFIMPAAFSWSQ